MRWERRGWVMYVWMDVFCSVWLIVILVKGDILIIQSDIGKYLGIWLCLEFS